MKTRPAFAISSTIGCGAVGPAMSLASPFKELTEGTSIALRSKNEALSKYARRKLTTPTGLTRTALEMRSSEKAASFRVTQPPNENPTK